MIITIDGQIHHLKELAFIEEQVYGALDPDDFYKELKTYMAKNLDWKKRKYFTKEEVEKVDSFVKEYFNGRIEESKQWLIRAYMIGRLLSHSDLYAHLFNIGDVAKMPKTILELTKKYNLTLEEAKALEKALENGAIRMTNTSLSTMQTLRMALEESIARGEGVTGLNKRLQDIATGDIGELNRDWLRVSISEVNQAFSDGYLALIPEGDYVVGISMPDACPDCIAKINLKVYKVRATAPGDYSFASGEEYERLSKIWEKEIWVGKSNIGRSASPRRRIDPGKGNKDNNLTNRQHHELTMPVIPLHPHCRCRWVHFNPEFQFIDEENGVIKLKMEDPDAWKRWYEKIILGAE